MPTPKPSRIAFAGTPADAVPVLEALHGAGHQVPLVVTVPPARRSRRSQPVDSPVGLAARNLGLPVSYSIADAAAPELAADYVLVVAFGQIIAAELLATQPMLNLHFSVLPRWRGAAPVERALLAGDTHIGVCLMQIEPELDTGPVYWCEQIEVGSEHTATELRFQLAHIGARKLVKSLETGLGEPMSQSGEPTYAHKLNRADRQLLWDQSAEQLKRVVRVGGAWTTLSGETLKIHAAQAHHFSSETARSNEVAGSGEEAGLSGKTREVLLEAALGALVGEFVRCASGALELKQVQPAGRKVMPAADWLRGARLKPNTHLGG